MLCDQFLKGGPTDPRYVSLVVALDQEGDVPSTWPVFWSEAQQMLVALGMDLGDAGYAIQAPPDPSETPDVDPNAPALTREQGFKGVDLTGKAGPPVRDAPNILEGAQPGDGVPDRIEMEFEANEKADRLGYWEKNPKAGGGLF